MHNDLCDALVMRQIFEHSGLRLDDAPVEVHQSSAGSERSGDGNRCTSGVVHSKAEEIKKQLSSRQSARFNCTLIPNEAAVGGDATLQFEIDRAADFEEGCSDLFARAMLPVHRLLDELGRLATSAHACCSFGVC